MTDTIPTQTDLAEYPPANTPPALEPATDRDTDSWFAAAYISVAAFILAIIDPINVNFESRPTETIIAALAGTAVVLFATARRIRWLLYVGVGALFVLLTACVITQPSALNVPVVSVWPLRILIVLLVGFPWALLMRPGPLLRRALIGVAVPTFLAVIMWGGPAALANTLGVATRVPPRNFSPFWLSVGGEGTLYATDVRGGMVWVFDQSGNPKGTLRPAQAPQVSTPGPGILPVGMEEEINMAGMGVIPTSTPRPGTHDLGFFYTYFEFCGIATDDADNLYAVDVSNPEDLKLLRFNKDGNISGRWELPEGFAPLNNCVTADSEHLYLADRSHKILVLSHEGKLQKEIQLGFQPYGVSPTGDGRLTTIAPNMLGNIDIASGEVTTVTVKAATGDVMMPVQSLPNGEALVTNHQTSQILRVNRDTGEILSYIGGRGNAPGHFAEIGAMTLDKENRIYVSDWRHRVIQRFTLDGRLDAVWWANLSVAVPGLPGDPDADIE